MGRMAELLDAAAITDALAGLPGWTRDGQPGERPPARGEPAAPADATVAACPVVLVGLDGVAAAAARRVPQRGLLEVMRRSLDTRFFGPFGSTATTRRALHHFGRSDRY